MKKVLAVVLSVIIVLLGLPCRAFADVQYIQAYSVSQGFANSQNETDGWSYAFAPPGTNNYGLFNHFYSFAGGEWWSYDSANNWAYGRMGMWQCAPADAMDVAYVFTLPADGIYALSSESGIKLGEYGNGINAAIFKNNTMIWPQNNNWQPVAPGETINYDSFSISGKQGEKIYFRVNSGGNAANDNTEWNAVITQTGTVYDATIDPEILQNAKMSDYFGDTQLNGHWSYQFADAGSNN